MTGNHPRFIVLLRHPSGFWQPLVDDDDLPMGFDSAEEAVAATLTNAFAEAFGGVVVDTEQAGVEI